MVYYFQILTLTVSFRSHAQNTFYLWLITFGKRVLV